jgi:hypothetical protein
MPRCVRMRFIDRALYLSKSWTDRSCQVPCRGGARRHQVRHRAGTGPGDDRWVAGCRYPGGVVTDDKVYGGDSKLRADLHQRLIGYVLAVARDRRITRGRGAGAEAQASVPSWAGDTS